MVVAQNMLEPAIKSVKIIKEKETQKISNVEDIPEEFLSYGQKPIFNDEACENSILSDNYEIMNRDKNIDIEELRNKYELPFQ